MNTAPLFVDTDPQVEDVLVRRLRTFSARRKWRMVADLTASARHLALVGLRARYPGADEATLQNHLGHLLLGHMPNDLDTSRLRREGTAMTTPEFLDVTLQVTRVLERLGIPYFITGSLASALYGVARTTQDADIVADVREEHVRPLVAALEQDFYISEEAVRAAVRAKRSFNLIHLGTMFKVDIFVAQERAYDRARLARRMAHTVGVSAEEVAYFASPEDAVLAKLEWYRKGGEISERQWNDVLGMLRVWGPRMDVAYMREWAARLGLDDVLERALTAAGIA